MKSWWCALVVLMLGLCALACGDSDPTQAAAAPEEDEVNNEPPVDDVPQGPLPVTAPGDSNVGFQRHELIYTPGGADAPRNVRVVIWYPTEAKEGEPAYYGDLLPREGVFDGAPVALEGPAPVLVFSHGSQAVAEQSWTMMEFYASHGWVVMAMDHPDNTLFDNTGNMGPLVDLRPQDVRQALDYIEALEAPETLAGVFSDDIMLAGHSFGGTTTLIVSGAAFDVANIDQICDFFDEDCGFVDEALPRLAAGYLDPRIKLAVSMTPGGYAMFGDAGLEAIGVPMMLVTGGRDGTLPNVEEGDPIWAALSQSDDNIRLDFPEAGHLTFSNLCEILTGFGEDEGCADDFMDPAEAHRVVNAYSMAFARHHFFGDDTDLPLLNGERQISDEVVVTVP